MSQPRVLLADDHTMFLESLQKLLEGKCDVVGAVEDGRAFLEAAQRLQPDLMIVDISMPLLNGLEAARKVKKLLPDGKFIVLTMHGDPTYATEAFAAGASAYLLKRSASSELMQAIDAALKGQYYLTPLITKDMLEPLVESSPQRLPQKGKLTPRQREVLQLVAEGHSTKAIAGILSISVKTVEFHKSRIMDQLDIHSTAELTTYAIAHGLISP